MQFWPGNTAKDLSLRPHAPNPSVSHPIDRITDLPDDLVYRILSRLSTKDAAAATILSRRMRRLFPWLSSLDFDDSSISHCLKCPYLLERFPKFQVFVDTVLQASLTPHLTRFKLRFGRGIKKRYFDGCGPIKKCGQACLFDMNPSHLNAWISFPLTRSWIREIDLCIHIRNHGQLPPQLFACETLEVLKLDVSLDLSLVCDLPTFHLPNLKVFHLSTVDFKLGDLMSRLVSSCPLLEELNVWGWWVLTDCITISSPSLRRFTLCLGGDEFRPSNLVHIDTPNLEHFSYADDLASSYFITPFNALVEAAIAIGNAIPDRQHSFPSMLVLVRAAHNVQRLRLGCLSVETLDLGNLKDQLPVFHNLKHLELAHGCETKWNTVLLELLHRSPILETLDFPEGIVTGPRPLHLYQREAADLERQCFRTTLVIPACCTSHLKRIVIRKFWGSEREMELVRFLLRSTLVLEEFVISRCQVQTMSLLKILTELPRASRLCSIQVQ